MMCAMTRPRSKKDPFSGLRRFARQTVAAVVLGACLLLAAAFAAIAVQGNAVARDATGLRGEIAKLEVDVARKQAAVVERQTDGYVVEKSRDLGFVKPGEALVAVQREAERAVEQTVAAQPSRIAKWWGVFVK